MYQYHRPDPKVRYEEPIGVLKELLDAGKVLMVGISNESIAQIDLARSILGEGNLASVQNQFSPSFRASEGELEHCGQLGIAFLPYSPLAGLATATVSAPSAQRWSASRTTMGCRSSRWCWPGCSPRATRSSRSPAPAGPHPHTTALRPLDLKLSDEELSRLDLDEGGRSRATAQGLVEAEAQAG